MNSVKHLFENVSALKLMRFFEAGGFDIRFVGGCVRDVLLGRPLKEIDLATTATPDDSMALLKQNDIHIIPTGIKYGTVTAIVDNHSFEITTLRRDVKTDGRHAVVEYGTSWQEDADRRDFTVNALSVDMHGIIHDYTNGQNDLQDKKLVFIGEADKRIQEDYLRILRYFRFASVLDWPMDDKTIAICKNHASQLKNLSRERIQAELYKTLLGPGCTRVLDRMIRADILAPLLPETLDIGALKAVVDLEPEPDALRRLIALGGLKKPISIENVIVPSNSDKKRLEILQRISERKDWSLTKRLYYFGPEAMLDWAVLSYHADNLPAIRKWRKPEFPILAEDVMVFTKQPGPQVGVILKQTEEYWVDQGFKPDKDQLTVYIQKTFF